ncbi:MAG: hypothetical protein U0Q15_13590 [Kineosporiaceae bacterium]
MGVDDASGPEPLPPSKGPGLQPAPLTGSLFLGHLAGSDDQPRVGPNAPSPGRARRPRRGGRRRSEERLWWRRTVVGIVMIALMGASIAVARTGPRQVLRDLGWRHPPCRSFTQIDLVASPDISPTLAGALEGVQRTPLREDGSCLRVSVTPQEPAATLAGAGVLPRDRWPHLWVPDSSLWLKRATRLEPAPVSVLATTPMVVATGSARAAALGWATRRPSWPAALGVTEGLSLPAPDTDTKTLLAAAAVAAGGGAAGDARVSRLALAGARSGLRDADAALDAAGTGAATAPVVATTEQIVFARNRGSSASGLLAVVPAEGTPVLDYPLAEIDPVQRSVPEREGMRTVEQALTDPAARRLLRQAGFRDAQGRADGTAGVKALPLPGEDVLTSLALRMTSVSVPRHVLVLVDVSESMGKPFGSGSRLDTVGTALTQALGSWHDGDLVGLWAFGSDLGAGKGPGRLVLSDLTTLGAAEAGGTHRQQLQRQFAALPGLLRQGGTPAVETTQAAVDQIAARFDPLAVNLVVLVTDGPDEGSRTSAAAVAARLRTTAAAGRPVRVVAVALAGADVPALTALTTATPGGTLVSGTDPAAVVRDLAAALGTTD